MHWFIDGAYGDLYRVAMRYPALNSQAELNPPNSFKSSSRKLTKFLRACETHGSLVLGSLCGALRGSLIAEGKDHGSI